MVQNQNVCYHTRSFTFISVYIPVILNKIPLATLATILILVGYKLAAQLLLTFLEKRKIPIYSFSYLSVLL
jgi:MFS superfamily sulfate permease-like transporter